MKNLFLTIAATFVLAAPAVATPLPPQFTADIPKFIQDADKCAKEAYNEDFNKFRAAHGKCLNILFEN